ncbi:hypothetical protein JR316_0013190 [Psilocybe cubensis]|uniref:Uncharacterized protein n=1 Tax=Psilocybe cubensis TaxID=181762 RepID=A0ACB8GI36_PSICU|nr:hypothetical protein JR316_0013190 [Psilocybe cubensis]KAH9474725.1 hypothetical protein JR316_0013190 [Psilocybe cubensis]
MVRGRPTRGGSARKSKNQKTETVTDEKFASLKPFGSFVVSDPETNEGHKFKKEDNVAILPHGRDPGNHIEDEEYWIAKIKDIRAELHEDGSNTVWARVQWFYSADDVASVIKSFDKSTIGKYEKIFSDHYDYVGPESFNAIIPMAKFYENDPEPPYIPWDKFYRRYTFEYKARMLKPKPASKSKESATTFVSGNSSQATVSDIPKKRKRGERGSLLSDSTKSTPDYSEGNLTPSNPIFSRSFRLLSCSPDTDETINLQSLIPLTVQSPTELNEAEEIVISRPAMKKRKGRRSVIKNHVPSAPPRRPKQTIVEALGSVPFELLHIAEQPLVRGAAFANGGISGNIAFVTRARRLLYKLLQGEPMPERWEDEIFVQGEGADLTNAIVKIGASQRPFPPFVCPNCKSAI